MLTRRWNERSEKDGEKDVEKDGEKVGRRKNQLGTSHDAEQQQKVKNTDEKFVQKECQTSTSRFIFVNHPRNGMESGGSEENPSRRRDLRNGLRECQIKEERK